MAAEQERAGIIRSVAIGISFDQHKWSFPYVVFSSITSSAQFLGFCEPASGPVPVGVMKARISVPLRI